MFNFLSSKKGSATIPWISLTKPQQIDEILEASNEKPIVIFKHSTRCSISSMAMSRLTGSWKADEMEGVPTYYLDVIQNRDLSMEIQDRLKIQHESPQLLVVQSGKTSYHTSHGGINYEKLKAAVL